MTVEQPGDFIEPAGDGADRFDIPSVFYLSHREQIERWHELKPRAADAVHEYLLSFENRLVDLAAEQGLQVGRRKTGRSFRCLLLWPGHVAVTDDHEPPLAIGLRWHRNDTAIDEEGRAPRVGIRAAKGADDLRERFLTSGEPSTRELRGQHGYRSDKRWPVLRQVEGGPRWWGDLDAYRASVIAELGDLIRLFGPRVSDAYPTRPSRRP
jgi:hypothetical protein